MDNEQIRCPKCGSTLIHIDKRGFKTGRAIAGGLLTGNILVATAAGGVGKNNIEMTCLKCGHKFKAGQGIVSSNIESCRIEADDIKVERQETSMYRCDCGKKSCLPIDNPVCPSCGRKLRDDKKITQEYSSKSGCLGVPLILFISLLITFMYL